MPRPPRFTHGVSRSSRKENACHERTTLRCPCMGDGRTAATTLRHAGIVAAMLTGSRREAAAACEEVGQNCDRDRACCDLAECWSASCTCKSGFNDCSGRCKNLATTRSTAAPAQFPAPLARPAVAAHASIRWTTATADGVTPSAPARGPAETARATPLPATKIAAGPAAHC